jgi:hypothetical protein
MTTLRTPRYHAVDDQPLAYSVDRLAVAVSLGKDLIWRALNAGVSSTAATSAAAC